MSRIASVVFAVSLVLYGASCFILPASTPRAPQQGAASAVGQPSASAAPESAGSWSPVAIGAALGLLAAVATARPALAADLENGESIFQGNCTACHAGGNNTIVAEKKLKKDALVTYGKYDVGAIITQVTNGNGAMPAFGDKLGPDDIEEPLPDLPVCILGVACRFDLADSKFRIPVVIEGEIGGIWLQAKRSVALCSSTLWQFCQDVANWVYNKADKWWVLKNRTSVFSKMRWHPARSKAAPIESCTY